MKHNVLYVEDDKVQATIVSTLLKDEGNSVFHVPNGFKALEALSVSQFDVILTDYYMPNMDGVELVSEITAKKVKTPVIVMTAANDVSLAFNVLRAGAVDFITKDESGSYLDIIIPVVNRTVEKHRLEMQADDLAARLEREKHLSHITMDALSQGVLVLNEHRHITYCNESFLNLFKVESLDKILNGNLNMVAAILSKNCTLAGVSDLNAILERLNQWLDNDEGWLELTLDVSIFEFKRTSLDGHGYVLTFTDITEKRARLAELESIIAHAPVAILAVDVKGTIVLANERICALIGLPAEEVLGTDINRFVPIENRDNHHELIRQYFDTAAPRQMRSGMDVHLIDHQGNMIPVEVSLSGIRFQNELRVLATVVDLSQRKEADSALLKAQQLTQSIIDNSPFGVAVTDTEGNIIAASPALEKMLGYKKDELIHGGSATDLFKSSELESRAKEILDDSGFEHGSGFQVLKEVAKLESDEGSEWMYVRKDGSSLPVNLTINTLRSNNNHMTGYILVAHEIVKQKAG